MKMLAFDIETNPIPESGSLDQLGVICCVMVARDFQKSWPGKSKRKPKKRMKQRTIHKFVSRLYQESQDYQLVSWNGVGFDLKVLSSWCDQEHKKMLFEMAPHVIDLAYTMLCERGFMVGLNSVAVGMNLSTKTMDGVDAAESWDSGETKQVIDYCKMDCSITLQITRLVASKGQIIWMTRAGKISRWSLRPCQGHLATVEQASQYPEPDTGWMDDPWPRERFTAWYQVDEKKSSEML